MAELVGQTVSHYRVLAHLGSGGMGVVYKALDTRLDRTVALKFLPPELTRDSAAKDRFIREAKAASSLDHANICVVHEIEESEDHTLFIVMPCYEGETLQERIERGPVLPAEAEQIVLQIAHALQHAHEHGIVHRDLKPANIFLTSDGTVKILDFGLAKLAGQSLITRAGSTLGTVAYMSPEQARGEEADHRTDIWSLGVVFYEMVTGRLPFPGEYAQVMLYQILNAPPAPLEESSLDTNHRQIILRCLQKASSDRYQSSEEVAHGLMGVMERSSGDPGRRPRPGHVPRRKEWVRRAAIIFGIAVVVVAGVILLEGRRPDHPAEDKGGAWGTSIAVLPFRDLSPQKDQEYFSVGMTDAVIDNLTRTAGLKTIALTSVMRYRETRRDLREIAAELGVSSILVGSVQREADRIRVRTQLVDAKSGQSLWSHAFDQDLRSVFEVQEQIARSISSELNLIVSNDALPGSAGSRPGSLEAYEYYMKGMYFIKSRFVLTFREEDFLEGLAMFDRAIATDSAYAQAYLGRVWAYEFHYQVTGDEGDARKMQENCARATELDPFSGISAAVMGYAMYEYGHSRTEGLAQIRKGLGISPNNAEVNFLAGTCYLYHGLLEPAITYLSRALALDPYYFWTPYKLGYCYMRTGRYDQAASFFENYFTLAPVQPLIYPGQYIRLKIWKGDLKSADSVLAAAERATPEASWLSEYRSLLLAAEGEKARALNLHTSSEIYALLAMKEEALQELEHEIRGTRSTPYIYYLELLHNPSYDLLRSDPRFQAMLQREKALYDESMARLVAPPGSVGT